MSTVLRFLLFLANTFLVMLAIVSVGGRILMHYAAGLEDEINGLLATSGVSIQGLDGGWHGLDPVLEANRIDFPGGHAETIRFELDLLESLLHGTVIARHLGARRLEITPVRTLDGRWSLRGRGRAAEGPGLDPIGPFIEYSDRLELPEVRLRFVREAPDNFVDPLERLGDLTLDARIDNRLRRHSGRVRLAQTGDACTTCALEARWDLKGVFAALDQDGAIALDGDGFRLPAALGRALGFGGATVERLTGRWSIRDGRGGGRLEAVLREIALPAGALDAIELEARGEGQRLLSTEVRFAVPKLIVRAPDGAETSIDGLVAALRGTLTGTVLEWSVPTLDIATQVPIVNAGFSRMRWSNEWLPALRPRGRVEGLSGRFSFASRRLALAGEVADVSLEHYKGSPFVRNGRAAVIGSERGFLIQIEGEQMTLGLLDVYPKPTTFDALRGDVHIWFRDRFLQVRGDGLVARLGPTNARATFAVARPQDPLAQRVSLWIGSDLMDALVAKSFVPAKLPAGIRDWIDRAVLAGSVSDAAVAFHGHLRSLGELPVRQTELRFAVDDGAVRFHDAWPLAAALDGRVVISADRVRATLTRGTLRGIVLGSGVVEAVKGGDAIRFAGEGTADGTTLLHLVADSPLEEPLSFLRPGWRLSGPLDYRIELSVPLRRVVGAGEDGDAAAPPPPDVTLTADLRGVDADRSDLGLVLEDVRGPVEYRYPFDVRASRLTGRMFGSAATFSAASEGARVRLGFAGSAAVGALEEWLGLEAAPALSGTLSFTGELDAFPGESRPIEIAVRSDLVGATVALPPPFAKGADDPRRVRIAIAPGEDALVVHADVAGTGRGWLRLADDGRRAGTFVLGEGASEVDAAQDELRLTGSIAATDVGEWLARLPRSRADAAPAATPLAIRGLRIAKLTARDVVLEDLTIDAWQRDGAAGATVASESIGGSIDVPPEGPWRLSLAHLRLPASATPSETDPLAGFDMSVVDAIDVDIAETSVGGQSYGNWRFALRRDGDVVRLEQVVGDLRGLHIEGSEPLVWRWRDPAESHLVGGITARDVGEVLTAFGYARSAETKKTKALVDLRWPGSPLNFALPALVGTVDARAEEGRFLEVDSGSGPLRVFSLLNFTAIAKRMALDFSDVFGKGVSFEVLTARLAIDGRRLEFVEPMVIDGTGGYFRVSGRVDLETGLLDNEMIVTLPVNKSLPWYAAYLSFVNPLAAGAVLVGERIFRNQIQQFSSATYRVSGTLEDPKVDFVGIFGRPATAGETPAAAEPPEPAQAESNAPAAAEPS